MKPNFLPKLINDPLGDPGMMVEFLYERRALLFDLGDLSKIPNSELLKISHVFVSHTHIDHFIGFDRLLRVVFGREKTIHLFGPKNFITNVEGKLAGFTWNLVDRYSESVTLDITEVHADRLVKAKLRAIDQFQRSDEREDPFVDGVLVDEDGFTVRTAILEHRVPCLGFALKEKYHVNIRKDRLEEMNYPSGAWLNELKQCIYEGKPDDHPLQIPSRENGSQEKSLGHLKEELVLISPGQKIAYVTDTVYTESNRPRIVDLVRESDIFFCESPFLAEEADRGLERCHLTARQAGLLAGEANVKKLNVFHFSGRHTFRTDQLVREAEEAFRENRKYEPQPGQAE
ncbi:MAG: ribonuclease Z [Nitrospinaceae bacterium]|jgi:ribonuclease Z|nr:ribonuclease Z [Nitrospinaceae bacterium]MDP7148623.1 ribonuclease Z [Nitrospinaceae bacterium]|tara:strand:- start:938 stop:1969 length:1032 start_codon:yes stop_codon:yes gene_type:complete